MCWLAMYAVGLLLWAAVSLTLRLRQLPKGPPPIAKVQKHGLLRQSRASKGLPRQVQMSQATHHLNKPQMPRWGVIPW